MDNGTDNRWDDGGEGNYWSDWVDPDDNMDGIVDFSYVIDGNANASDFFPSVQTIEIQAGTDPRDNLSIPSDLDGDGIPDSIDPDRDGDGVSNVSDSYPDDSDRWENEGKDGESETKIYIWVGILILVSIIAVAAFILHPFKKKNGDEVEQSLEDELGRVKKSDESDGE